MTEVCLDGEVADVTVQGPPVHNIEVSTPAAAVDVAVPTYIIDVDVVGDTGPGGGKEEVVILPYEPSKGADLWVKLQSGAALTVWLDGSDVNADGTQPADGAKVWPWRDKSGNGYDCQNGEFAADVTFSAAEQGVFFPGFWISNNVETIADFPIPPEDTVYCTANLRVGEMAPDDYVPLFGSRVPTESGYFASVASYDGGLAVVYKDATDYFEVYAPGDVRDGQPHVLALVRRADSLTLYLDGAEAGSWSVAVVPSGSTQRFAVSCRDGTVTDALLYAGAHSASDVAAVTAQLLAGGSGVLAGGDATLHYWDDAWKAMPYLKDAPADGLMYGRKDGGWGEVVAGGGGGAPSGDAGGDLSGTYPNPQIATGAVVNADISATAAIAQSKIAGLVTDLAAKQATSEKGAINGYASLDETGKVPSAQLPVAGGGTTILHGSGAPADSLGSVGNYYLDETLNILYGPKKSAAYGASASVYTSQTPGSNVSLDGSFGADFVISAAGRIVGLKYYRQPSATDSSRVLRLWDSTGAALGNASTSGDTGTGWKTAALATPVAVAAGVTVRASYEVHPATDMGRTSGAGSTPITNGSLQRTTTYGDSGAAAGVRPVGSSSFDYLVDIEYQPLSGSIWPIAIAAPLVLGPTDPVPGGTPAGTVIVRTA